MRKGVLCRQTEPVWDTALLFMRVRLWVRNKFSLALSVLISKMGINLSYRYYLVTAVRSHVGKACCTHAIVLAPSFPSQQAER